MSSRSILTAALTAFCLLCAALIVQSGIFRSSPQPCILLQSKAAQPAVAIQADDNAPAAIVASGRSFTADGGPAEQITLGSLDANTGFEFEVVLSSKGAGIERATLSGFDDRNYKNPQPLVLLSPVKLPDGSQVLSLSNEAFVFVRDGVQLRLDRLNWRSFDVEKRDDGSQTARFEAIIKDSQTSQPVVKVTKTYRVVPKSYHLECDIDVENLSPVAESVRFGIVGPAGIGKESPSTDERKVVGGFRASDGTVVPSVKDIAIPFPTNFFSRNVGLRTTTDEYQIAAGSGSTERTEQARADLDVGRNLPTKHRYSGFLWAAITNKYFAAILRPMPDAGRDYCDWLKEKSGWYYNPDADKAAASGDEAIFIRAGTAAFDMPATNSSTSLTASQASASRRFAFQVFLGPKDKTLFDSNPLYKSLGFFHTIDFMPCCCCPTAIINPLAFAILWSMKWMYTYLVGNYGIVIIILVFIVRLLLHPLTKKSQVSMSKMTKLGPKAEEIKQKYADDKTEMNRQMMALYREHGASPVMGMVPMMVQMPIWIALYGAIYASIELRGASFLPFWITDLSAPDALFRFPAGVKLPLMGESFNLLPILMGVAFYLQQKLTPSQAAAANPQAAQQQKMMMIMMPILFPLMLYNSPSGLNLYIMASSFAGVVEQYVIRKHIQEKEQREAQGLVPVTSKTGGKVKKKKPKPFFKI